MTAAYPTARYGAPGMRLRDGTPGQRVRFGALVAVFAAGVALAAADNAARIGQPNIGWMMDGPYLSPTRQDASSAGLLGGGRALRVNGLPAEPEPRGLVPAGARVEIGAANTLEFETPQGTVREVTLAVTPWTWRDIVFTSGATDLIALLFFAVGATTFVLRPYEIASWALLTLCTLSGSVLITMYLPIGAPEYFWSTMYFLAAVGFTPYTPYHTGLAFPVVHRVLLRYPRILWLIYGLGLVHAVFNIAGFAGNYEGPFAYVRRFGAWAMMGAIAFVMGRCCQLAVHTKDPLVAQRARILLAGAVVGLTPFTLAQFMQQTFGAFAIDPRFTLWPLAAFVFALARVTVRHELLNGRIAVRRAVLYAGAVGVLTGVAWLLIAVRPWAVAALFFPLLYLWPRFDAHLQRRLYPQRAHFPELLRAIGAEMAACGTVDTVLDVLAEAPRRLCDARTGVAFLLRGATGPSAHLRATDPLAIGPGGPLGDEPLVQLLCTTRKEILRDHVAVDPQYSNIKAECHAGFDRLRAVALLPLVHRQRVAGGLAVGPRATGDVYERAEIDALSTVAQQAVQAIMRVEATDRLRAREMEFAELKRFFPPQVIDQVMARGGAAELRSQRKVVTVVFADLRGFTSFSDSVEPEDVMATLAEYHAAMGRRIAEYGGTLEHFAGDGFMVFFNDPVDQPDHAARAVGMALAMRTDMERLRERWARKGHHIHLGVGVDTGYATCGFVGYEGRRDYGVVGNVTNLAARLSDAAAPGEILVSARVYAELGERFRVESVGELELKGFHQPYLTYRLLTAEAA